MMIRASHPAADGGPISAHTHGRSVFIAVWLALLLIKVWLAAHLDLFGDEAFYRLESLHPALSYSDLPPLTAWLMAAARFLFGDHHAGLRAPFLALGAAVPWLVFAWARRRRETAGVAWQAALLACALPLSGLLGVLALPDVPLTCAMLLSAIALDRALQSNHRVAWALWGLALALGWLSHYRFVFWYAAGFGWLMAAGSVIWRNPRFWWAQSIGVIGLLPTLLFNFSHDWAGVQFQFVDRHPWRWHADAMLDPLWQAAIATPPLFLVMMLAMVGLAQTARRGDIQLRAAAWSSAGMLALVWILGAFADSLRSRFHWPLPALLLILPWVALWLLQAETQHRVRRWIARSVLPFAFAGLTLAIVCLGLMAGGVASARFWRAPMPGNLLGWREVGAWVGAQRASGQTVVADNFLLAAELSDQLKMPVPSLDHTLNSKHGRQLQLALWNLDESALANRPPDVSGWLVAEPRALAIVDWAAWQQRFCSVFDRVELRSELWLPVTGDRWLAYAVTTDSGESARQCALAPIARLDAPACGASVVAGATTDLAGWLFFTNERVRSLRLAIGDSAPVLATYGLKRPDVVAAFGASGGVNANTGFLARVDTRGLSPGLHPVRAFALTDSGRTVAAELPQRVRVVAASGRKSTSNRMASLLRAFNADANCQPMQRNQTGVR